MFYPHIFPEKSYLYPDFNFKPITTYETTFICHSDLPRISGGTGPAGTGALRQEEALQCLLSQVSGKSLELFRFGPECETGHSE